MQKSSIMLLRKPLTFLQNTKKVKILEIFEKCSNQNLLSLNVKRNIHSLINIKDDFKNKRTFCHLHSEQTNVQDTFPDDPVMYNEVLHYFDLLSGSTIIDMTFGSGGHSTKILEANPDVKIFALDRDPVAYECAKNLAERYPGQVIPMLGQFSELPKLLKEHKVLANSIDGFLFEFGCSTKQLKDENRGFSVTRKGHLDMRMNGNRIEGEPTAADVLESVDELDLIRILRTYGDEKRAKEIARAIIETRSTFKKLETTKDLVQLMESVVGAFAVDKLNIQSHTAYKTFRALRYFINNELNEINYGITLAQIYLKIGGKAITIAHDTLEDKIVKQHLTGRINDNFDSKLSLKYSHYNKTFESNFGKLVTPPWKMLHKHVLTPTEYELDLNPNLRNTKMRVLEKIY